MENEKFKDETFEEALDNDALTLDDLGTGYIGNPAVGESVQFTISKIVKLEGKALLGKDRKGKVFSKNLSNVEFGFEITTKDGNKYTVPGWEVYGKLKSIFQKLKLINGVELEITHLVDGMKKENKEVDKYKVAAKVDGVFRTLDRETKEWSN